MATNIEDFNDTNKQEYRENLYKDYCSYWRLRGLYSDELCWFKNQQDQSNFVATLEENRLPVDECMAAYYVLVYHKYFDPSDVKAALLAWCDPEKLVQCKTQEELIEEKTAAEIKGNFWYMGANRAASYRSRWYDSPYF